MFKNKHLDTLVYLRGFCAFAVVLGHSRFLNKQVDISSGYSLGWFERLILLPTSLAEEAVSVFFLISGFLVGQQTFERVKLKEFSWGRFLIDRLSRYWTVLLPGLVITYLFSKISVTSDVSFNSKKIFYEAFCNCFFLMSARCSPFQNNNSLWSLGYEFFFYLIFALVINAAFSPNYKKKISYLILTLIIIALFGPNILILMPAWLFGFFISLIYQKTKILVFLKNKKNRVIIYILFGLSFFLPNILNLSQFNTIIMSAISVSPIFLILITVLRDWKFQSKTINLFLIYLGNTSFSIYVFHVPIIQFIYRIRTPLSNDKEILFIYFTAILSAFISSIFYFFFEKYTRNVRYILNRAFE